MSPKKVTLREIAQAIVTNGLPKARGEFFTYDPTGKKVVAACAIGQAAHNLGLVPRDLYSQLAEIYVFDGEAQEISLREYITGLNDRTDTAISVIGAEVLRRTRSLADMELNIAVGGPRSWGP